MSDWTPTTEWVRIMVGYAKTRAVDRTLPIEEARQEGYEWFDRWLASVKAEAKAEVLEELAGSQQFSDNWNRALYHDEHRSMLRDRAAAIRAAAENGASK